MASGISPQIEAATPSCFLHALDFPAMALIHGSSNGHHRPPALNRHPGATGPPDCRISTRHLAIQTITRMLMAADYLRSIMTRTGIRTCMSQGA